MSGGPGSLCLKEWSIHTEDEYQHCLLLSLRSLCWHVYWTEDSPFRACFARGRWEHLRKKYYKHIFTQDSSFMSSDTWLAKAIDFWEANTFFGDYASCFSGKHWLFIKRMFGYNFSQWWSPRRNNPKYYGINIQASLTQMAL